MVSSAARISRVGDDWRNADGVRSVIDSLRPGVSVHIAYGTLGSSDPISLEGHTISASYGDGAISLESRWFISPITLSPGSPYVASLAGGVVKVNPDV